MNEYGYDLSANWDLNHWGMGYDLAYDTKKFANLFTANYSAPKLKFTSELRDVNRAFQSATGTGWEQGEIGGLFGLTYKPNEKWDIFSRLDVYRDRLFPALDNRTRWNQDFDLNLLYRIDKLTDLNFTYTLQNDLGKLSQGRYMAPAIGFGKRFKFFRDIYFFSQYTYANNQNFSSPGISYYNNRANLGIRFELFGGLNYYFNRELNWLRERLNKNSSMPNATETGLEWNNQIGQTPFYGDLRFTYRDEEDTLSPLSFLSGQDYIEGYSELTYRKSNDTEIYGSCRVRNSWADNPNMTKQIELSVNTGLRYLWDTGISWNSVCNIEVCVFKDLNSDGLRQKDEPPVEGIKVWLGKSRCQVTDLFGGVIFKGVRGDRAHVSLDMPSLPSGYLLTVPVSQEVKILQNQTIRVNFGIMSRSEIGGLVFEDKNGNGKLDANEKGVEGVELTLDSGKKVISDYTGRYVFANAASGEHEVVIDLNSIPDNYLPKIALTKKIALFEGVAYTFNVPLEKIEGR